MKNIALILLLMVLIAGCVQQPPQTQQPPKQPDDSLYQPPEGTPSVKIVSPKNGEVIASSAVGIRVNVTNFRLADISSTKPNRENEGHIHYYLDDRQQMTPYTIISYTNVPAGEHIIRAELVSNDHTPLGIVDAVRIRTTG